MNQISNIQVGHYPIDIGIDPFNTIYILNSDIFHQFEGTVSVINGTTNTKIKDIKVGHDPKEIGIDYNKIYIPNYDDGTVSVIDAINDTKIKDIEVGHYPTNIKVDFKTAYVTYESNGIVSAIDIRNDTKIKDIEVNRGQNYIGFTNDIKRDILYVVNQFEGTVSVINGTTNTKIKDIKVGHYPSAIGIANNTVYVANAEDDTISVINGTTNTKTTDIRVGNGPTVIGFNDDAVYVANIDGTVSIIDEESNKVVARVMFKIEPFNSGHIECDKDKLITPLEQHFYLYNGANCTAKPSQGFEFVSWQENLNGNSTQLLQVAPAPSIFDSILDLLHVKPDKPEATLNITKFGSFTANFKALPPPVPAEYIATLFSVVVTAFVGTWLTPTVISWRKSRNQGKKLDYYFQEINSLQDDGKLDDKDIYRLDYLRNTITNEYTKGKIDKEQFDKLGDEISTKYREVFKDEIQSLDNLSEHDKGNKIKEIKSIIDDAYAKGKLNETHYKLLKEKLSEYEK